MRYKVGDRVYHAGSDSHGRIAAVVNILDPANNDQDGDAGYLVAFDDADCGFKLREEELESSNKCCSNPILGVTHVFDLVTYKCDTCGGQIFE